MNKYLISILSLSLLTSTIVYADCTKEEINYFKEIEDQYKVTYEFDTDAKTYEIIFENPAPDKYGYMLIYNKSDDTKRVTDLRNNKIEEFTCLNQEEGEYTVEIFGTTSTCNEKLKTINLKLSKYNKYSEDPLCEGIEEFVLCQETYEKDIDYDTFVSRVNTYKETKAREEAKKSEEKITNKIIEYIKDNIFETIIIIIFIIMVIVTIVLTVKSRGRRLE